MVRVFGIGFGLFVMLVLWPLALFVCVISSKAKPPLSSIGSIAITILSLITVLLLLIPREVIDDKSDSDYSIDTLEKESESGEQRRANTDWMFVWRPIIIMINIFALIFGFIIIFKNIISKPIARPKLSELKLKTVKPFVAIKNPRETEK